MKKTKIFAMLLGLMLAVCLLVSMQMIVAGAAEQEELALQFVLSADGGEQVVLADQGDEITVSFIMRRTDAEAAYTLNGFQNYIHYDLDFFELVEESIVCNGTGSSSAKKLNSITYGEILQCQNMSGSYEEEFAFCSFRLRVIGESGSGLIENGEVHAFDSAMRPLAIKEQHLRVMIDIGCTHTNKTTFEASSSSCETQGWDAYAECDDCDAIFDAQGDMLAVIPYVGGEHVYSNTFSYDAAGHWFACTGCDEKRDYAAHSGGVVFCNSPAICEVCLQQYGEDVDGHIGQTRVENKKMTWFWGGGYTGDVYCESCAELIEAGHATTKYDFNEWPIGIWVLAVPLFPIVVLGWLVMEIV